MVDHDVLIQLANAVGGLDAGDVISKAARVRLHRKGLVWPAYGATFWLTPAGKRECESRGINVAPTASLSEETLKERAQKAWESDWDMQCGKLWLAIAK